MAARRLGGVRCLVAAWIGATLVAVLSASGWAGASPSSGRLWTASFADAQHGYDTAQAAVVSPDGGLVYVTGYRGNGHQTGDYLTIAFDAATGKRVWQRAYDGPQHLQDFPAAIGVSPNGSTVFVTGTSAGAANEDVATVAYDALTGTLLWATRFDGPGHLDDYGSELAVSADGTKVFVGGSSGTPTDDQDVATIAYDASTGGQLWLSTYDGPGHGGDGAAGMAASGTGVYVAASSWGGSNDDFATLGYDQATGAQLWATRYDHGDGEEAADGAVSPDGLSFYVTGYSVGTPPNRDFATVAYDTSNGSELWVARYSQPGESNAATTVRPSPDGSRVYVTGSNGSADHFADMVTVGYESASGTQEWVATYNGPADRDDTGDSLGVSPDGSRVYVTGHSFGLSTDADIETIAYAAATGAGMWSDRLAGPGTDVPNALAVGPTGGLFMVGQHQARTGTVDIDWVVAAYAA